MKDQAKNQQEHRLQNKTLTLSLLLLFFLFACTFQPVEPTPNLHHHQYRGGGTHTPPLSTTTTTPKNPTTVTTTTTTIAPKNNAILFIKPHANNPLIRQHITTSLRTLTPSMTILSSRTIDSQSIVTNQHIDQHYYAISDRAVLRSAMETQDGVDRSLFEGEFGEVYDKVLEEGRVGNCLECCRVLGVDEDGLLDLWREAEGRNDVIKVGGGFYVGKLLPPPLTSTTGTNTVPSPYYVLNAFFLSMRSQYTQPGASVTIYELEWDPKELSWKEFREGFVGCTDPGKAKIGSLRRDLYDGYKEFGLEKRTSVGENGVHASASPLEGTSECCNWLSRDLESDPFAARLIEVGVPKEILVEWCKDPRVKLSCVDNGDGNEEGDEQSDDSSGVSRSTWGGLFDAVEDLDSQECFERLVEIHKLM